MRGHIMAIAVNHGNRESNASKLDYPFGTGARGSNRKIFSRPPIHAETKEVL